MKNESKWFYCFNTNEGDGFLKLEHEDVPENPTFDELNTIAQKFLRDYGYTDNDDFVSIGKGRALTIEGLGGCLGIDIIEMLECIAGEEYGIEEPLFSAARQEDFENPATWYEVIVDNIYFTGEKSARQEPPAELPPEPPAPSSSAQTELPSPGAAAQASFGNESDDYPF